jgi:hypothetical protein
MRERLGLGAVAHWVGNETDAHQCALRRRAHAAHAVGARADQRRSLCAVRVASARRRIAVAAVVVVAERGVVGLCKVGMPVPQAVVDYGHCYATTLHTASSPRRLHAHVVVDDSSAHPILCAF